MSEPSKEAMEVMMAFLFPRNVWPTGYSEEMARRVEVGARLLESYAAKARKPAWDEACVEEAAEAAYNAMENWPCAMSADLREWAAKHVTDAILRLKQPAVPHQWRGKP